MYYEIDKEKNESIFLKKWRFVREKNNLSNKL